MCTHLENPLVHYDHKHIETPPLQNGQDSSKLSAANWHTSFEILHFCLLLSFLWDLRNKKTVAELHKRILQKPNPRPKYLHFYVKQLGGGFFSKKPWPCCRQHHSDWTPPCAWGIKVRCHQNPLWHLVCCTQLKACTRFKIVMTLSTAGNRISANSHIHGPLTSRHHRQLLMTPSHKTALRWWTMIIPVKISPTSAQRNCHH